MTHYTPNVKTTGIVRWIFLPGGFIKINFEGTLSSSEAAVGYVLRDWQGRLINAGTRFMHDAPILVSKANAIQDGIKAALD